MEEWKQYKISEIVEEIAMGPFGSNIKVDNFIDFGIPVLNGSNLQGFKLNEDSFNYVSEDKADSLGRANAFRGDVVITHRGTLGQIVYIPSNSKYKRYIISQSQFRLKLNLNLIRPDFFVYFFHTRIGQHRILMNASQVGVPALARPTSTFKEVSIPIPPMEIQNKVMAILLSLDDKIELNRRINDNLEQQAQALFKAWFVDFKPFKDGKFVDSELGKIPEGWEIGYFTDIVKISGGGTPKTNNPLFWNGSIPFFTPKDASDNVFTHETEKHITDLGVSNCNSPIYPTYTVFITARGTIGKIRMAGKPMAMNQSCYALLSTKKKLESYIYLLSLQLVNIMQKKANGAVFEAITTKDFKERIVIPTNEILTRFTKLVNPLFSQIHHNGLENQNLTTLRDSLLPRLMSGELSINTITE